MEFGIGKVARIFFFEREMGHLWDGLIRGRGKHF